MDDVVEVGVAHVSVDLQGFGNMRRRAKLEKKNINLEIDLSCVLDTHIGGPEGVDGPSASSERAQTS